jgi:hypothetical protein
MSNLDPRTHVDGFLKDYARTGNPLCAWFAYEAARLAGRPIPDLVLQYFDRVADRFGKIGMGPILAMEQDRALRRNPNPQDPQVHARRRRLPQPPNDPAAVIAKALEMHRKGRGSVFARLRALAVEEHLAWEVAHLVVTERQKPDQALNAVAEYFGVSRETVRRAWARDRDRALADIRRVQEIKARRAREDEARPPS